MMIKLVTNGVGHVLEVVVEVVSLPLGQPTVAEQLPEIGELRRFQRLAVAIESVEPLDLIEQDDLRVRVVHLVAVEYLADRGPPRGRVAVRQFDLAESILEVDRLHKPTDQVGLANAGHAPQVDDDRTAEHLGHEVPDPDGVHHLVDDVIDTDEEALQLGASGDQTVVALANGIAIDGKCHSYLVVGHRGRTRSAADRIPIRCRSARLRWWDRCTSGH